MNNKLDWKKIDRGVFMVNVLAIIHNPRNGKILIGRRIGDPFIPKLKWCFPGGRPSYKEDLEHYLKLEVKKKTNLDIEIKKVIFARTHKENRRFLSIFYLTEAKNIGKEKAGDKFAEIKWVNPMEAVKRYFTTSTHQRLVKILEEL
jgi:ADP-ribose pyrophosphatase YjhB (NUDIX family)